MSAVGLSEGRPRPNEDDPLEALLRHDGFAVETVTPDTYRWKDAGADFRRRYPIRAYIGMNGSGKSLAMVHDVLPSLRQGRTVLSTVPLIDPATGQPYPSYVPFTDWTQLLEIQNADVLMDEILGVASSRASAGLPGQVALFLNKLRKADITLSWTAPAWNRADVIIREVTRGVTVCRGWRLGMLDRFLRKREQSLNLSSGLWKSNRLFQWSTYSAEDFATWTDSKESKLSADQRSWFWGPTSEAFRSYDTLGAVERVGHVDESGVCAHCGGTRARKKCTCGEDH